MPYTIKNTTMIYRVVEGARTGNSQLRELRIDFLLRMSEVRNGEQKGHKYLYSEIFYGCQKLHK